ncbi:LDLR chaperone boca-like [Saccostrea echinata]|uniref:LDLR chaperone boca-like n=1 Tax=Saccostrea echinata TaxID=191078 RepID=UPI002A81CFCA|nr:LDLR chaperone boca-like [Saccostrea echinata]
MKTKGGMMSCTSHVVFLCLCLIVTSFCAEEKGAESEKWKKKDIRDYSEADLERLFDQWEENDDEELPEDELPEWKKEPPKVDLSQLDPNNPELMLQASKKGRTLMMFATVSGDPTEKETEQITQLWQTSLFNANYEVQRYVVSSNRVIFMIKDGSKAWEIKDFLITQDRCEEVTIEGKNYPGAAAKSKDSKKSTKKEDRKEDKHEDNVSSKKSETQKREQSKNDIRKTDEL